MKAWSRRHPACIRCGSKERKHQGGGLCKLCYYVEHEKPQRLAGIKPGIKRTPPGQWCRDHVACIDCGTTKRPHRGFGRCSKCYFEEPARKAQQAASGKEYRSRPEIRERMLDRAKRAYLEADYETYYRKTREWIKKNPKKHKAAQKRYAMKSRYGVCERMLVDTPFGVGVCLTNPKRLDGEIVVDLFIQATGETLKDTKVGGFVDLGKRVKIQTRGRPTKNSPAMQRKKAA